MSSLVFNGLVLFYGDISEDSDKFYTDTHVAIKQSFPGAFLIQENPPNDGSWSYEDGQFIDNEQTAIEEQDRQEQDRQDQVTSAYEEEKRRARIAAIAEYERELQSLESAYPEKERETWPQQVTEARAFLDNNDAHTPLIDSMLIERHPETKAELVAKIIANYSAYSAIVGAALGRMQKKIASL
jgi:HD-GYP domain-containing protein (c-di-GMP phosphodiesterase class II)